MNDMVDYMTKATAAAMQTERGARLELRLLANLAPAPRQGFPIINDLGVTADSFLEPDHRLVYEVLELTLDKPASDRPRLLRAALQHYGYYEHDNPVTFLGGCRWGPGMIAALFCRLEFDAGRLCLAACNLLVFNEEHAGEVRAAA